MPDNDDDDCNKELKRYADKLKNMQPQLKVEGLLFSKDVSSRENVRRYGIRKDRDNLWYEIMSYICNPIPEEVACRAVEILENAPQYAIEDTIGDYTIHYDSINDWLKSGKFTQMYIDKEGQEIEDILEGKYLVNLYYGMGIGHEKRSNNINDIDTRWWK